MLWKIKLPGAGTSSPIITGDKIIVTCNAGYGTAITKGMTRQGQAAGQGRRSARIPAIKRKLKLLVVCLDRKNGEVLWKKDIKPNLPETPFTGMMREHSYASSTAVTDGKNVYVFFGKTGVFAFDLDGEAALAGRRRLEQAHRGARPPAPSSTRIWSSSTPPSKASRWSLSTRTPARKSGGRRGWAPPGRRRSWSRPRKASMRSSSTCRARSPAMIRRPARNCGPARASWPRGGGGGGGGGGGSAGRTRLRRPWPATASSTPSAAAARRPPRRSPSRPAAAATSPKRHVLWKAKAGACNCSPVLAGDYLCWVDGTMTCLNIADGKVAHKTRLYDARNEYVSAVAAGDKIYALTRADGLFVVSAGTSSKSSAISDLDDDTSIFNASPAISDGRMYLRSNEYLYCIGRRDRLQNSRNCRFVAD